MYGYFYANNSIPVCVNKHYTWYCFIPNLKPFIVAESKENEIQTLLTYLASPIMPRLTFYCPKKITAQSNGECRHATGFWLLDRVHPTRYCTDLRVVCVVGASPTFRPPVGCRFPRSRRCSRSTFLGKLSFSGASSLLI
jgi:hypothetical protein